MKPNIIIKTVNYKSMNIGDKLLNRYFELEGMLKETLLSKKIVKNLRRGNIITVKEANDKIQKMPFWKVMIDSHVNDVIDKEQFKKLSELSKKVKMLKYDLNADEDILEEQKLCYDELTELMKFLKKENEELRKEWNIDKIKKFVKDSKIILIGILVLIMLMIAMPSSGEKKAFELEDKCGKFVNLVSHTIEDEAACETRCRAQCIGIDHKYDKVEFKESEAECNKCTCFCK